jgi:K+-sensing histidine kinase KdpD
MENNQKQYLELKQKLCAVTKASRVQINRLLGLSAKLAEHEKDSLCLDTAELSTTIRKELFKLFVQNTNTLYLCSEELLPELPHNTANARNDAAAIPADRLVSRIVGECNAMLSTGEKADSPIIVFEQECERCSVKIDEKILTLAVMNLLQNALLYSLPGSNITVAVISADESVCIKISNLSGEEGEVLRSPVTSFDEHGAGLGLPVVAKIAACYGGNLEYIRVGDNNIATLTLPFSAEKGVSTFTYSAKVDNLVSQNYGFVRVFMEEVV